MSTENEQVFSSIRQSLSPFIKSRREALRIRQILTLHLASAILGSDEYQISPASLAVPGRDVHVDRIPPEFTGLRRDYLSALQANVRAREQYDLISQQSSVVTDKWLKAARGGQDQVHSKLVTELLDLEDLQKQQEKLQIIQKYLLLLRQKDTADEKFLPVDFSRHVADTTDGFPQAHNIQTAAKSLENDVQSQEIVTRLEKAILQKNESLKHEKYLLEELKARHGITASVSNGAQPVQAIRIQALQKTRDHLIAWIEHHLAKAQQAADAPETESATHGSASNEPNIEQKREHLDKAYQRYLVARKDLVELLSDQEPHGQAECRVASVRFVSDPLQMNPKQSAEKASLILPYLTEHMIPIADDQKSLFQEESHLRVCASAQLQKTGRVLDKLADESHLLANYQVSVQLPCGQRTGPAMGGSTLSLSPLTETPDCKAESNISKHIEAWTLAADAAGATVNEGLEQRLRQGEQHASAAEATLTDLKAMTGFDDAEGGDSGDDLWNPVENPWGKGVWAGFDGNYHISCTAP